MAKKQSTPDAGAAASFVVGDRVEILHFGRGKVVELRGALGPGGAMVYRVRYSRKPSPAYIEVLGNQIRHAEPVPRPKADGGAVPVSGVTSME